MLSERSRHLFGFAANGLLPRGSGRRRRAVQGSGLIGLERSPSILIVLVRADSTTDDYDDYAISTIDWNEE